MHTNILSGSYSEIGREQGALIKGLFTPPPASDGKIRFTSECIEYYEEYTPGILEEIDGLSDEAELDPTLMKCFVLTLGLEPACTVLALSSDKTVDGIPVFARNYDWDEEFRQYFTVAKAKLKGGLASLTFTDHMVGRYGGVNEVGLAAAITAIPAYRGSPTPGIRMNIAVRWMMDHLETTEEAAEWLLMIPHQWAHNFLLADRRGKLARVETSPEKTVVHYSDGFVATTNHYHDEGMKALESEDFDFSNTHRRYDNVEAWYRGKKREIDIREIKELFGEHEGGVCNHVAVDGRKIATIWSWIAPLGERHAYVCDGPPCENEYKKIEF